MKEIEKLQKIAAKWILSEKQSYKQRLVTLNLLPLSLYIEMRDLLYLLALKQGKNDVELSNLDSIQESSTRQHSRGELQIKNNRLVRSDENFFHRTKILYNLVLKVYLNYGRSLNKNRVSKIFWQYFCNQYTEENKCTWRIVCKCGYCNINQKLMNLDN